MPFRIAPFAVTPVAMAVLMAVVAGCGKASDDTVPWLTEPPSGGGTNGKDDEAGEGTQGGDAGSTTGPGSSSTPSDETTTDRPDKNTTAPASTSGSPLDLGDAGSSTGEPLPPVDPPPFLPLYRILTRVHLTNSALTDEEVLDYLTEMNTIWRSQAGICFEFEVVGDDETIATGFDLWFQPEVDGYNGYYYGDHQIYVRDYPSLSSAPNPATFPGARTAAHELGHALTLAHDQGSDDYLLRSGTYGWQIPMYQVDASRGRAADKSEADQTPEDCGQPTFK